MVIIYAKKKKKKEAICSLLNINVYTDTKYNFQKIFCCKQKIVFKINSSLFYFDMIRENKHLKNTMVVNVKNNKSHTF